MVKSVLLTWSVQKYKEPVLFKISKRTKVQRTSTTLSFHQYNVLQFKTVHFSTFENIFSTFSMIFSSFINFSSEKHFATKMCTLKGNWMLKNRKKTMNQEGILGKNYRRGEKITEFEGRMYWKCTEKSTAVQKCKVHSTSTSPPQYKVLQFISVLFSTKVQYRTDLTIPCTVTKNFLIFKPHYNKCQFHKHL